MYVGTWSSGWPDLSSMVLGASFTFPGVTNGLTVSSESGFNNSNGPKGLDAFNVQMTLAPVTKETSG